MTETKIKIDDLPTVYDAKSTEEKMYKFGKTADISEQMPIPTNLHLP